MNPLIWTGTFGVVALSAAAVARLTIGSLESKEEFKSISKLVGDHNPERRLLFRGYKGQDDGSSEEWKFVWNKYFHAFKGSENNPFSVKLTSLGGNAPDDFMDACRNMSYVKVLNVKDERFSWVLEYCTRKTSVVDLLYEAGKSPVSKDDQDPDNLKKWTDLWNAYKSDNIGKNNGKDEWKLFVNRITYQTPEVPLSFKDKCVSETKVETGDKGHRSFVNALKYCSK